MERSGAGDASYSHSGGYSPAGLFVALLVALAIAAALSPIYAAALYYSPLAFINCFVTFGFGFAVGLGTSYGFRLGKVRSTPLATRTAFGIGVLADYFGWVAWLLVAQHRLVWQPSDLIAVLGGLAEKGSWSIDGSTPTGTFLWLIWTVELLAISIFSSLAAHSTLNQQVFCERCHVWLPKPKAYGPLEPIRPDQTAHISLELLQALEPVSTATPVATFVELRTCATCQLFSVYSVTLTTTTIGRDGKSSMRKAVLVRNAHASSALIKALAAKRRGA